MGASLQGTSWDHREVVLFLGGTNTVKPVGIATWDSKAVLFLEVLIVKPV